MVHNNIKMRNSVLAFTIIEVLVTVVILMIAFSVILLSTRSSIQSDQDSLDYGTAKNLAEEALEMLKNVRDTNFLKYSAYLNECWNYWKDSESTVGCDSSEAAAQKIGYISPIEATYYTTYINPLTKEIVLKGKAVIVPDAAYKISDANFDLEKFRLSKGKFSSGTSEEFFINYENMFGVHKALPHPYYISNSKTKFYRWIKIEYIDTSNPTNGIDVNEDQAFIATATVWWNVGGRERKVEVTKTFYNYLE